MLTICQQVVWQKYDKNFFCSNIVILYIAGKEISLWFQICHLFWCHVTYSFVNVNYVSKILTHKYWHFFFSKAYTCLMMITITHRTPPPAVDSAPRQVVVLDSCRSLFAVHDVIQWRVRFHPVLVNDMTTAVWHTSSVMPMGTRYTSKVLSSSF